MAGMHECTFYNAEPKGKGVNAEGRCPLCDQCTENTMQALFSCDIPKLVWNF